MKEVRDINQCFVEIMPSPEELFKMVMEYAKKTGKNEWKCMGEVFNASHDTTIMRDRVNGECVGYLCSRIDYDGNVFLMHAYLRKAVKFRRGLIEEHTKMVSLKHGVEFKSIMFITDLPERLWKRYGFEPSKEKIYERRF